MEEEAYEPLRSPHERSLETGMSVLYRGGYGSPVQGGRFTRDGTSHQSVGAYKAYDTTTDDSDDDDSEEEEGGDEYEEEVNGEVSEDDRDREQVTELSEVTEVTEVVAVGDVGNGQVDREVDEEDAESADWDETAHVGRTGGRRDEYRQPVAEDSAEDGVLESGSVQGSLSGSDERTLDEEDEDNAKLFAHARRGSFIGDDDLEGEGSYEAKRSVEEGELREVLQEDYDVMTGAAYDEKRPVSTGVHSAHSSVVEDDEGDSDYEGAEGQTEGTRKDDNMIVVDVKVPVSPAVMPKSMRYQHRGIRGSERIKEDAVVVNADREVEGIEGLRLMPQGNLVGPRLVEDRPLFIVKNKKDRPINPEGPPLLVERAGARPEAVYNKDGRVRKLASQRRRKKTNASPWDTREEGHRRSPGRGGERSGRRKRGGRKQSPEAESMQRKKHGGFLRRLLGGR